MGEGVKKFKVNNYYEKQFEIFRLNEEKFCFTWNWAAFFLGALWQLFRGLYVKFFLYGLGLYIFELSVWTIFKHKAAFFYPLIFLFGLFFYATTANYDLYLKKIKNESLWQKASFKKMNIKVITLLVIFFGVSLLITNLYNNINKGLNQTDIAIKIIDKEIEKSLNVGCDIDYQVHFGPTKNVYDLNVHLILEQQEVFTFEKQRAVKNIIDQQMKILNGEINIQTQIEYKN